jgi:hypothetical protein
MAVENPNIEQQPRTPDSEKIEKAAYGDLSMELKGKMDELQKVLSQCTQTREQIQTLAGKNAQQVQLDEIDQLMEKFESAKRNEIGVVKSRIDSALGLWKERLEHMRTLQDLLIQYLETKENFRRQLPSDFTLYRQYERSSQLGSRFISDELMPTISHLDSENAQYLEAKLRTGIRYWEQRIGGLEKGSVQLEQNEKRPSTALQKQEGFGTLQREPTQPELIAAQRLVDAMNQKYLGVATFTRFGNQVLARSLSSGKPRFFEIVTAEGERVRWNYETNDDIRKGELIVKEHVPNKQYPREDFDAIMKGRRKFEDFTERVITGPVGHGSAEQRNMEAIFDRMLNEHRDTWTIMRVPEDFRSLEETLDKAVQHWNELLAQSPLPYRLTSLNGHVLVRRKGTGELIHLSNNVMRGAYGQESMDEVSRGHDRTKGDLPWDLKFIVDEYEKYATEKKETEEARRSKQSLIDSYQSLLNENPNRRNASALRGEIDRLQKELKVQSPSQNMETPAPLELQQIIMKDGSVRRGVFELERGGEYYKHWETAEDRTKNPKGYNTIVSADVQERPGPIRPAVKELERPQERQQVVMKRDGTVRRGIFEAERTGEYYKFWETEEERTKHPSDYRIILTSDIQEAPGPIRPAGKELIPPLERQEVIGLNGKIYRGVFEDGGEYYKYWLTAEEKEKHPNDFVTIVKRELKKQPGPITSATEPVPEKPTAIRQQVVMKRDGKIYRGVFEDGGEYYKYWLTAEDREKNAAGYGTILKDDIREPPGPVTADEKTVPKQATPSSKEAAPEKPVERQQVILKNNGVVLQGVFERDGDTYRFWRSFEDRKNAPAGYVVISRNDLQGPAGPIPEKGQENASIEPSNAIRKIVAKGGKEYVGVFEWNGHYYKYWETAKDRQEDPNGYKTISVDDVQDPPRPTLSAKPLPEQTATPASPTSAEPNNEDLSRKVRNRNDEAATALKREFGVGCHIDNDVQDFNLTAAISNVRKALAEGYWTPEQKQSLQEWKEKGGYVELRGKEQPGQYHSQTLLRIEFNPEQSANSMRRTMQSELIQWKELGSAQEELGELERRMGFPQGFFDLPSEPGYGDTATIRKIVPTLTAVLEGMTPQERRQLRDLILDQKAKVHIWPQDVRNAVLGFEGGGLKLGAFHDADQMRDILRKGMRELTVFGSEGEKPADKVARYQNELHQLSIQFGFTQNPFRLGWNGNDHLQNLDNIVGNIRVALEGLMPDEKAQLIAAFRNGGSVIVTSGPSKLRWSNDRYVHIGFELNENQNADEIRESIRTVLRQG